MRNFKETRQALGYLRKSKSGVAYLIVLLLFSGLLSILPAQIIGLSIDLISNQEITEGYKSFIYNNISDNAYVLVGIYVAISTIYLLIDVMYAYRVTKLSDKFVSDTQKHIFSKVIRNYMPNQSKISVGDLIARITKEIETARGAIAIPFNGILRNIIPMCWILVVFLLWNYKLALVTFLLSFPIYFIAKAINKKTQSCSKEVNEINASLSQYIMNILNNIKIIHLNKSYDNESEKAGNMIDGMYHKKLDLNKYLSRFFPLRNIVKTTAMAIVLLIAYTLIQNGTLSSGDAVIVFIYLGKFFTPVITMMYSSQNLSKSEAALKRVNEINDLTSDYDNNPSPVRLKDVSAIIFDNVSCEIDDREIISGLNGFIKKNSITIIRGESGKGKSTLINLLLSFLPLHSGEIHINGIQHSDIVHNPENISVAFQEHNLFNRSIGENIAYNSTLNKDRAMELLEAFNLREFIDKYGFDYIISDQANNISGGERKRLSVIRAIYKEAPVYILDEPSAELDADNIIRLKKVLLGLKGKAAVIISTHDRELFEIGDNIIDV